MQRWMINWEKFREACDDLAIRSPVIVRLEPRLPKGEYGQVYGRCRPYPDPKHLIQLYPHMSPIRANRVLFHELSHAEDFEREIRDDGYFALCHRLKNLQAVPYHERLEEHKARQMEELAPPLIVPAK